MTRRAVVTQAELDRMRRAIVKAGLPFRGFRKCPDGSFEALVGEPGPGVSQTPVNDDDELDAELAAWRASHGEG